MRKIKLHLESLAVESFHTAPRSRGDGTVEGHLLTIGCETGGGCLPSGNGTCGRSCTCPAECQYSYGGSCPGEYTCGCPTTDPGGTINLADSCAGGLCGPG